jgi:hypothetical protein
MSMMDELRAAAKRETGEDLVVQIRIIAADPPVRPAATKLSATTVEAEPREFQQERLRLKTSGVAGTHTKDTPEAGSGTSE